MSFEKETGTCAQCRFWLVASKECHLNPPAGDNSDWPKTEPTSWCGQFRAAVVVVNNEKVSAKQITDIVADKLAGGPDEVAAGRVPICSRTLLIGRMMELGLARSSAIARIRAMEARGELIVKRNPDQTAFVKGLCVWLPDSKVPETVVRPVLPIGRPMITPSQFVDAIHAQAPTEEAALGSNALHRVMGGVRPIGRSAFYRLVKELQGSGILLRTESGRFYAPMPDSGVPVDLGLEP